LRLLWRGSGIAQPLRGVPGIAAGINSGLEYVNHHGVHFDFVVNRKAMPIKIAGF
jgi:hypothetical protein